MRKLVLFLLVLIIVSPYGYPQNSDLAFETLSVDQGMPTYVTSILQDRTGYLWFSTWGGLYRYDGYSFVSYKHNLDDTTSIIDNTLSTLYEDKAGVLWVGSWFGLEKSDRTTGTFMHYTPNPSAAGYDASNNVWAIREDKYGVFWVGTGNGLYKLDRVTGQFTCLRYDSTDPGSISHNSVQAIYEDKEGSLWFGTSAGLDKLDFETGKFTHYWNDPSNRYKPWHTISKHRINSMFGDNAGILWLGTNEGLVEFDPQAGTFFHHLVNSNREQNHITSICQDVVSGFLWIGSWNGLFAFDKKSKKITPYIINEGIPTVYSERSGTFWAGTNTDIRKINRTKQPFKTYSCSEMAMTIQNGNEETIWVYTFSGWRQFNTRTEQFVPHSFGRDHLFYVFNSGADLAIRTEKGGLYIRDSLGHITFLLDASWKGFVNSLSFGWKSDQGYFVGSHEGGFYLLDPATQRVKEIRNLQTRIYNIREDSHGLVWVATYMGNLFCYNQEKDTVIEFVSDPTNPSTIGGRQVNDIYEDRKGRIWFATTTGLHRYEHSTNSFIHFTEKHGLLSDNIRGILEDDRGDLWLNTSKGISKFNPDRNQFTNYDISYGLQLPANVYYGLGCRTRNGEMYFAGAKGFTRFHPDSIKDNPFMPPVVITFFRKFDKPYPFSHDMRLPFNENFLSFEFAALSYISPERNQYAHKLEGLDKDWVYSGTRRYASYPNLEPGEYIFRVKGSNNDGLWNETGTSISIVVSPPWWKTTWAYILYSMVTLSIMYFAWKMQVKRIRMGHAYDMSRFEAEKLHEVDELKSRFFANISHEFRTPLTLILGPVKQIIARTKEEETRDDLKVVHKNANRLLGLVNQLLDISKLESGTMKLQTVFQNIIPLLKALVLSFTSYAERKGITLTFNSREDEILVYIDRDKIEKIITNVLSNAFKFTPEAGRIDVAVTKEDKYVNVTISDTGIGIPHDKIPKIFDRFYQVDGSHTKEQEGTGIGLSLTKELVELHKGTIDVESTEGKGTTFVIRIPQGKEHLKSEEISEPEEDEEKTRLVGRQVSYVPEEMMYHEGTRTGKPEIGFITETEKPLLLIVEDNADVRHYIRSNVNKDYRILEAIDGEDGWNKSIEHMPDVIISDVMMPKMDGFRLCGKLKTDERTSHIPVILLTAKASSQDKIEGFDTGADDYIMKPFEPEEVKARIRNLVEQRKRIHEYFRRKGIFDLDKPNITSVDKRFLQKAFDTVTRNISEASFNVESFAEKLAVSRYVLYKKTVSLTGESPVELIRRIRLNKAAELIQQKFGNLSEIALEVGFNNPAYFSDCFKKQFGVPPSQYHQKSVNN